MKNQGTEFEEILHTQHDAYAARGVASLEKVTQPIKVFGPPGRQKVIHLANPFLDFVGVWKERDGRAIFLEAKVTSQPRLALADDDGLKTHQLNALQRWHDAGAAVGLLWHHRGRTRFFPLGTIWAARESGRKSLAWADGLDLEQDGDLVFWDYMPILRRLYP